MTYFLLEISYFKLKILLSHVLDWVIMKTSINKTRFMQDFKSSFIREETEFI